MSRIVCDAGPLIVFSRECLLPVLAEVAGQILVPADVFGECTVFASKSAGQQIADAARSSMITCLPPGGAEISPSARLGKGELAVIAAARQFGCPALMDDQLARRAARQRGVQVIGSAGILLAAKKRGIIPAIAPVLLA